MCIKLTTVRNFVPGQYEVGASGLGKPGAADRSDAHL